VIRKAFDKQLGFLLENATTLAARQEI